MKTKIEIKHKDTGEVLYSAKMNNNSIKKTLKKAIEKGIDLSYADLKNADLSYLEIRDATFVGADFTDANLSKTAFHNVKMGDVNFTGTCLNHVHFSSCSIEKAQFNKVQMYCVEMTNTYASGTRYNEACLSKCLIQDTVLSNSYFIKTTILTSSFECSNFDNSYFNEVKMESTIIDNSYLLHSNFELCDLSNTRISGLLSLVYFAGCKGLWTDFSCANLCKARFLRCEMIGAHFCDTIMKYVSMHDCNLTNGLFERANIYCGEIIDCDLTKSTIENASLVGATIYNSDPNLVKFIPMACPSDGEFIGWKKVKNYLIQLLIPAYAKRLSAGTRKCRCDKAIVLDITDLNEVRHYKSILNEKWDTTPYQVGKEVIPDWYDENRWNECSHGIHFFINKEDAINY